MSTCSASEIKKGTDAAKAINQNRPAGTPPTLYAEVDVTVREVTLNEVVITTRGEDLQAHEYRIPKRLVWVQCPSVARTAGEKGGLYISKAGLEARSSDDANVRICGSTPDANGNTALSIKWPDSGASSTDLKPLEIWPTSIKVSGYAFDDLEYHSGEIELLDMKQADSRQDIRLSAGDKITLNLTPVGRGRFNASTIEELKGAVTLLDKPFDNDARERADAWMMVAEFLRRLEMFKQRGDDNSVKEIGGIMSLLPGVSPAGG